VIGLVLIHLLNNGPGDHGVTANATIVVQSARCDLSTLINSEIQRRVLGFVG